MQTPQYDWLIFIGRFQPYHRGHHHVATEALKKTRNLLFVLGSHDKARSTRNPFATDERIEIIKSCFPAHDPRIHFGVQHDHTYNDDRWVASLQDVVHSHVFAKFNPRPIKIGIVGHDKDHSTYYLHKFPQWDFVPVEPVEDFSATIFRDRWLNGRLTPDDFISVAHADAFYRYAELNEGWLVSEYETIQQYKRSWQAAPFPPTFQTVDAVVVQSGSILLVQRRASPGRGLWALPGGFVNQKETLKQAVIRELYEETRISVPKPVLQGSITKQLTFDDPDRSERGRTITEAYLFRLEDRGALPKIKGGDDAAKAFWVTFNEVRTRRSMLFEDHYAILEVMVGL
jgi:bifunctional NMN adenylyltransferase/nudix hydrolase